MCSKVEQPADRVRRGQRDGGEAATLLDRVTFDSRDGRADRTDRAERGGQDDPAARSLGGWPPTSSHGRITWAGHAIIPPSARRAIVFQRPVMLRRSVVGQSSAMRWRAPASPRADARGARRRAARHWSGLPASASGRRGGSPAASSSGSRWRARSRAIREVLFLDEPTASLDPAATKAVEDVIRGIAARGIKVVMSTHDLGEARRLAGEIVLMHRGRVHRKRTGRTCMY